jgi:hypothetical protein
VLCAVGARGFEPPTSRTRTVRASRSALRPDTDRIIPYLGQIDKYDTHRVRSTKHTSYDKSNEPDAQVAELRTV